MQCIIDAFFYALFYISGYLSFFNLMSELLN